MVIKRCFGVLKAHFPILKLMPTYRPTKQRLIVTACCIIHNYIHKWGCHDTLFHEWENISPLDVQSSVDLSSEGTLGNNNQSELLFDEAVVAMSIYRDHITNWMWIKHMNTS